MKVLMLRNIHNKTSLFQQGRIGKGTKPAWFDVSSVIRFVQSLVVLLSLTIATHAFSTTADSTASDPRNMGWMEGFPPPADKVIGQPSTDYFSFPKLRWTFCHFRQLQASRGVNRGLNPISTLQSSIDPMIDAVTFTPINADAPMTWRISLDANYTDVIVVMHRGEIVYEYYSGCLDRAGRHGAMSVTKSLWV